MEKNIENKEQKKYNKGQVFTKIMAGILALMMLLATAGTLIFSLIGQRKHLQNEKKNFDQMIVFSKEKKKG